MASDTKSAAAFRTIGEVAEATGVAPHILRYWESRFPQLRPVTRAGNRRHYRPADVALVERIDGLLNRDGYTVKGVQQLLAAEPAAGAVTAPPPVMVDAAPTAGPVVGPVIGTGTMAELRVIRDFLSEALAED